MTEQPKRLTVLLQPKQQQLYESCKDLSGPTQLGFGGSRGCAKSGGVRRIAISLMCQGPGIIIWIMRRVWDDLNKDHVKPLFNEYPELQPFWRAVDHELRIPVGGGFSSIFFIHAGDSGRAKRKARGPQAHYIFLEQAEEFTEEEMQQLAGSNRAPGVPPGFCKRIYTFNPGGVGTAYLRRIFWNRDFHDNEDPQDFMFIQGFGWDNYEWFRGLGTVTEEDFYHSPEWTDAKRFEVFTQETDFGKKLFALPESQRIGELMGSFEKFSGQYYSEVWEESAIVLPMDMCSKIIQPWWRRWLATDWGFSHYAATGWFASGLLSPTDVMGYFGVETQMNVRIVILYRTLVLTDTPEPVLAKMIVHNTPDPERREIRDHWMGHDAWAKRGSANTVVEQMEPWLVKAGMPTLAKADIDRVGGWRLMYNCWASARKLRKWPGGLYRDHQEEQPAFFVSAACPEVVSAVPMLICDKDDPLDIVKMPGNIEDDVADMCFTGDTLVECECGPLPIRDVRPGMRLWTRSGLRAVAHSWSNGIKRTARATFTDGKIVTMTPNHPIWNEDEQAFYPVKTMRYGVTIATWDNWKSRLANLSLPLSEQEGCLGNHASGAETQKQKLTIQITTNHSISYGSVDRVTGLRMALHQRPSELACSAIDFTKRSREDSAQMPASRNGGGASVLTMSLACASSAEWASRQTDTTEPSPVHSNAVRLCGLEMAEFEEVFDLEVEGAHEFFAGGILVHNCRYGLKSYLTAEPKPPREVIEQETYDRYQDPTARAMAMLHLRANQDSDRRIQRRPRA